MNALQVIQLLNLVFGVAEAAGVNYVKLMELRLKALEQGRELTAEDLAALAADAQAAIDKL